MKQLCQDLRDEYNALDAIVADIGEEGMDTVTPFYGWTVRDEITHIAYFDEAGRIAANDRQAFMDNMTKLLEGIKDFDDVHRKVHEIGRAMSASDLISWWRKEREAQIQALEAKDPKDRLPWYGPDMSARSFVTARLMETWAHGQDVADALKVERPVADRLKHVAHIGFITYKWSFLNRKMDPPAEEMRVELESPSGELWAFGPEGAENVVRGTALDFCLVATQRRNVADTGIITVGEGAKQWMSIAQAFAGPPENPPEPGERV